MDEIRRALTDLNRAWQERRLDDLGAFFAEDVVMQGPAFQTLCSGRAALVKSYADFMARSQLLEFSASNHIVHRWGQVASIRYDWAMTWEQNGRKKSQAGHELMLFERRQDRWLALLRIMLF